MRVFRFFTLWMALALAACGDKPAQPQTPPADPTGLSVEQLTSRSARLSWTAAGDADSYYVFARGTGDAYYTTPTATLPGGSSSYEFTGLTPGASYHFGVQAVGKDGKTLSKISYSDAVKLIDYEKLPQVTATASHFLVSYPDGVRYDGLCFKEGAAPSVGDIVIPSDGVHPVTLVPGAPFRQGVDYQMSAYLSKDSKVEYTHPVPARLSDPPAPIHLAWQKLSLSGIPSAIEVYETTSKLNGRAFHAWYAIADCTGEVEFRVQNPSAKATVDAQAGADCWVLVNGGIYGTKHIGVIIADGVRQPWRDEVDGCYWAYDSKLYNITRAAFGTDASGKPATYWVGAPSASELYWYDRPLPTVMGEAQLGAASATFPGTPVAWNPVQAISTGPMLLYGGQCVVDRSTNASGYYRTNYEVWPEDVFPTHPDRTAVGYTADGRIVLFVCDGRIASSDGAYVDEVALILQDIGCVGAINLDGGGSTGMIVAGQHLNDLTGGNRAVLSTLGFFKKR